MIYVVGDIDSTKFEDFLKAMEASEKSSSKIIDIVLSSVGGSAIDALGFHDRIKNSHKDVRITVYGNCQSAAVMVFAAGDTRRMSPNSWVMVHEDTVEDITVSVAQGERLFKDFRMLENQWNDLLEAATGTAASTWQVLHKAETWLTAEECLEYGLATEIV